MQNDQLKISIDEWHKYYCTARDKSFSRWTPKIPSVDLGMALTGVRRSGKTYSAIRASAEIEEEKVLYYNFEDPLFTLNNDVMQLDRLISIAQEYRKSAIELLILDEIQNVSGWERWLRKIIDQKRYRVIVTGSSAKLLSSELATSLTGRCLEYQIWPLSFSEFRKFRGMSGDSRLEMLPALREYITWGGFPEVVKENDISIKKKILEQYFNDIIHKDIVNRNSIRNKKILDQICIYYLTNVSSLHSYSAIKKAFNIPTDTTQEYTQHLQDAFLIFEMMRYHQNLKVQSRDPKKIYAIDLGLRASIAKSVHDDTSRLLENMVYIEIRRLEKEVTYFKGNFEVDFVITENYKATEAIQVCYDISQKETREREINAMLECLNELDLKNGLILTFDTEEKITMNGKTIEVMPIYRWLS